MEKKQGLNAKLSLICYFALLSGILVGSLIVNLILFGLGIDYLNSPFPIALIAIPVNETIVLVIILLFASHKSLSSKSLGIRPVSAETMSIVFPATTFCFMTAFGISIAEEIFLGPNPLIDVTSNMLLPRNLTQLIIMIVLSLVLVGPIEELAFRGFIQKGFESSLGRIRGLLVTSGLFGLLHGLNSLYSIIPTFVSGLIFGYVWQKTQGNTTASALTHGIYNSLVIALAYFLGI